MTPGETRPAYDGYEASKAIIQDCEDSLTNWVSSQAAVSSKLSTRSRTLSQRRRENIYRAREGVDLAAQDQPMKGDRDSWAAEHQQDNYPRADESEIYEEEELEPVGANGDLAGREEERAAPVIAS